ncbi:hypothetical protein I545_0786 [Mycobacterium kansasii 662]|uniref:Uncharacterized protein n=1 Tax=Mycobacterium kansasii 662 TaxID=1299326 RepID=X7ZQ26_MYCKA|nr:hypothetical protein I545_0786 [Mycobacterium kansasii 662]
MVFWDVEQWNPVAEVRPWPRRYAVDQLGRSGTRRVRPGVQSAGKAATRPTVDTAE